MHLIEGIRVAGIDEERSLIYRQLLERTIHRASLRTDEPMLQSGLRLRRQNGTVTVKRRWNFTRGGRIKDLNTRDGEEVIVESDGQPKHFPTGRTQMRKSKSFCFPIMS